MPVVRKMTAPGKNSRKVDTDDEDNGKLTLPTKKNVPPSSLEEYPIAVFGEKGIGKTSLLAQLSDITFQFERGRKNLPILQIPDTSKKEPPLTWKRFLGYKSILIDSEYTNVCLDTWDRMYELCFDHVCWEMGVKHPSGLGNDNAHTAWRAIKNTMEEAIADLIANGIVPRTASHARKKKVNTKFFGKDAGYDLITMTCSDAPLNVLKSIFDIVIYYGYEDRQRILTIRGDSFIDSACGLDEHFLDPEGNQVFKLPAGNSAKEAADVLRASFNNEVYGLNTQEEASDEVTSEETDSKPVSRIKRKGKK